ncbi:MAG: hypothetical protein PHW24_05070, partial [Candidatus Moranbacteria bacterium]|nr:hypothetical protein [Candidatus Moranbacteria bacterium]
MNKGVKIFVGVVVSLGILSGIFLLFAKKKTPTTPPAQVQKNLPAVKNSTVQPDATKKVATPQPALPKAADSQNAAQDRKTLV